MSVRPKFSRALGALSGVLLAVVAAAPAAGAATVRDTPSLECSGTIEHARIDTDVVVLPGRTCTLDHVLVLGLAVLEGASVTLRSSEVQGFTFVSGGTLAADAATFGSIDLRDAEVVIVDRARVRGSVGGSVRTLELDHTFVTGDVDVVPGDTAVGNDASVRLAATAVDGDIATDGFQLQATSLTAGADVRVSNATLPSHHALAVELCGVTVVPATAIECGLSTNVSAPTVLGWAAGSHAIQSP